jgi:Putative restriction endonuclease
VGFISRRAGNYWENYKDSSGQGGEAYVEVPCRTNQQIRRPDVAYLISNPLFIVLYSSLYSLLCPLCSLRLNHSDATGNDITSELVAQFGNLATLPQSFPLIAEIVSPTDIAEDVFLKAQDYLASSCQEVWLVFPESHLIFVLTQDRILTFRSGDTATPQQILLGFSIELDRLLA